MYALNEEKFSTASRRDQAAGKVIELSAHDSAQKIGWLLHRGEHDWPH
jgi:hypothetical protein